MMSERQTGGSFHEELITHRLYDHPFYRLHPTMTKSAKKRPRREVVVVACPNDEDLLAATRAPAVPRSERVRKRPKNLLLDWNDTKQEIRSLGASAWEGKQRRRYRDDQYERLTGRSKKRQRVPLPIVRGIQKKAVAREERQRREAQEAGLVLPKQPKKERRQQRTNDIHGPAPSIGFVNKGVLRVKGKPR